MEKVDGKELGESWFLMTSKKTLKVISQIVDMESSLFPIKLPASGSVYYQIDLDVQVGSIEIPGKGKGGSFCIGPDAHSRCCYKERALLPIDRGPCK